MNETETPAPVGSGDLVRRLDALSPKAKEWLDMVVNQFADDSGYTRWAAEQKECAAAGLVTVKPFGRMSIDGDVMDLVYSEGYFRKANSVLSHLPADSQSDGL